MKGKGYGAIPVKGDERGEPPASDLTGEALKRAYDHALRVVDRDAAILDQLRSRASILLAALAVGGTVLGGVLSSRQPPLWLFALLGLPIVFCIFVLWSTHDHGRLTIPGPRPRRLKPRRPLRDRPASGAAPGGGEPLAPPATPDPVIAATRVSAEQVRVEAQALADAATRLRDRSVTAASACELVRSAAHVARVAEGPGLNAMIEEAKQAIGQVAGDAQALIGAAAQTRDQAGSATTALDLARAIVEVTGAAGRAGPSPVIAESRLRVEQAIGQLHADAQDLAEDARRSRDQVLVAIAVLKLVREAAGAAAGADPAGLGTVMADNQDRAEQALGKARDDVRAAVDAATRARGHADAAAAVLETGGWRLFTQWTGKLPGRTRRGWQQFTTPWREWFAALVEGDQRLWKVGLGRDDLLRARRHAEQNPDQPPQDSVDQVLLGLLHAAHLRNDGTINRRADLLRFAAVLALVFVIALGVWLSSTTPTSATARPSPGPAATSLAVRGELAVGR